MKRLLYLVLLLFSLSVSVNAAGKIGMTFLKIGVDARAAAMGEAYTAIANDAAASFWNPAGLSDARAHSVVLMHNSWLQNINHEFAAVQLFHGKHNIAVALNMIRVAGIQLRGESATETPDGETSASNVYLGLSYATTIQSDWKIGAQIKYLYEKYYLNAANGFAIDIGLLKRDILPNLSWGLTVNNIGKMEVLRDAATKLPIILRTGISYILPWEIVENKPLVAADYVIVLDDISHLNLGFDMAVFQNFNLRLGYVLGKESYDFTAGFGVRYTAYNFAYAFVPFQYDLGNTHRFSLIIDF
jgi:hypothetical protein